MEAAFVFPDSEESLAASNVQADHKMSAMAMGFAVKRGRVLAITGTEARIAARSARGA